MAKTKSEAASAAHAGKIIYVVVDKGGPQDVHTTEHAKPDDEVCFYEDGGVHVMHDHGEAYYPAGSYTAIHSFYAFGKGDKRPGERAPDGMLKDT